MNKSEFKKYLQRGLGRCVIELKDESSRERFKDMVLNACKSSFSYDTQSEGTRSRYVYNMVCQYPNQEYFIQETISAFNGLPLNQLEDFEHISSLLTLFALDGNQDCSLALSNKYQELFEEVMVSKPTKSYDCLRDCFEYCAIAILRMGNEQTLIKFIRDIGQIFTQNKRYDLSDFSNFQFYAEERFGKTAMQSIINKNAKNCEYLAKFLEKLDEYHSKENTPNVEPHEEKINLAKLVIEEVKKTKALSVKTKVLFQRKATLAEKERVIAAALKEIKYVRKMALLSALTKDVELIPCDELLNYANSPIIPLKKFAIGLLCDYQSPKVRNFAYENIYSNISEKKYFADFIKILINNYQPEDQDFFELILSPKSRTSFTIEEYHDIGMKVIQVCKNRKLPVSTLLFVYENTPCSVCRNSIVEILYKNKKVFDTIANECVYDSFSDTAKLAKRYLR